jgi:serpin B
MNQGVTVRSFFRALFVTGVGALIAACGESFGPISELPRELSVAEGKLVDADNRFAFKLFREINEQESDKNIFISPLSVGMALGMTYNGAAGTTREAMQQTLELRDMTIEEVNGSYRSLIDLLRDLDPQVEFLLANSIWYRNTMSFEQEFLDLNTQFFDADVSALDFGSPDAATTINDWVRRNTSGRIEEIVASPIDAETIMFLINAIYFKANWASQFDRDLTQNAPFFLADGSQTTVEMMSHEDEVPIRYLWDLDKHIEVVDLPYGGRAFSMTILLPESPQGVDSLVDNLTHNQWTAWTAALDSTSRQVSLPKFTLEYELNMNDVLKSLGMSVAFSRDSADFTNLYAPGNVFISKVKHKTFVDVNEEGTEAAAATSVEIGLTSAGPMPIVIDRPFVFAIREYYSGTVLFVGKILDPNGV